MGNLDPRAYQIELFERAKKKNIIAVLDTGKEILLVSYLEGRIYNLLRLRKDSDRGSFAQAYPQPRTCRPRQWAETPSGLFLGTYS